jgi:holo-[acyl-carrier protein] synthase
MAHDGLGFRLRVGVDLVEVERIARLVTRYDTAAERLFTPAELEYCRGRPHRCHEHMAARFAVKEAVLKALGTGLSGGIRWTDVETVVGAGGRPHVKLAGAAAEHAGDLVEIDISISHTSSLAVAYAVGVWPDPSRPS